MKRLALTLVLLAAACAGARGQQAAADPAEEKRQDIVKLLKLTRGVELGRQIITQTLEELRRGMAFLPDEQREKVLKVFEEEMLKEFTEESVIASNVPLYEKNLTAAEVKGLIEFYQSPLGQKIVEVQPLIMHEAYEDGTRRGREAGRRAMARIVEEGLLPAVSPAGQNPAKPKTPAPARRKTPPKKRN